MRSFLFSLLFSILVLSTQAQTKLFPSHWFVGFKRADLNLIIQEPAITKYTNATVNYPGVTVVKLRRAESPNYLLLDLRIAPSTKAGKFEIRLTGPGLDARTLAYELKQRSSQNGQTRIQGVHASDFIYLIMTDRFANGDPSNDIIKGYRDTVCDRSNKFSRHGGDFKGVDDRISYLKELGVSTVWLTPVNENDMPRMTEWGNSVAGYHGYWFTDHYQVDKRFGGNAAYRQLSDRLHQNGMKLIQDAVYNHIGNYHWLALDPPSSDWLNSSQGKNPPHHREEVFYDPYASAQDKRQMLDGWFVPHLPDLNQRNADVTRYLIQYHIWATEEYGVDGWRVDTYKYNEEKFLNEMNDALTREFPKLTVFGESWVTSTIANAYFTRNNMQTPFRHNAEGMLDFQTCFAMIAAAKEENGWSNGVIKLYFALAQDALYKDPMKNCVFLDNHDMDRIFSVLGEDEAKFNMCMNWLFTLRGMPQLYYGTEVLMKNFKVNTDATVREDFPGGWISDDPALNRFQASGRTEAQSKAFSRISKLAQFRRSSSALGNGKLMQFIPRDGTYLYFRYTDQQTVLVIANSSEKSAKPDWSIYQERTNGFKKGRDVITGETFPLDGFTIGSKESRVLELIK
jgi:glycosidase